MKLGRCTVENFGSYSSLELDFSDMGLALMAGPTGSGKSTIPDVPAWVLYGVTAKDGNADEVRSWHSPDEPTTGTIEVETLNGHITVTRIRGKAAQNDLYWTEASSPDVLVRGKDLNDTQKRLSARLGVDSDLYIAASYFHEFSQAGQVFTLKAKDRREVFEKVAALDLPAKIAAATVAAKKETKAEVTKLQSKVDSKAGEMRQLTQGIANAARHSADWVLNQMVTYGELKAKAKTFEQDTTDSIKYWESQIQLRLTTKEEELSGLNHKYETFSHLDSQLKTLTAKIKQLEGKQCEVCGGPKDTKYCKELRSQISSLETDRISKAAIEARIDILKSVVKSIEAETFPYGGEVNAYEAAAEDAANAVNPFLSQISQMQDAETAAKGDLEQANEDLLNWQYRLTSLEQLYDLSGDLRGALLTKAVKDIQDNTNRILETYFDGEIRVEFTSSGDALDVQIQKSGYPCVYKQLSKGQRQLLKLSFVISIMDASANKAGVHFDNLWFDESLDGLDSDLKVKAFGLFSELEAKHGSVVLIDHAEEFKNLFSTRYSVAMTSDRSEITLDEK